MKVDTRDFAVLNDNKDLSLELYVVSCYKNNKYVRYYSYTSYEEAKDVFDKLINLQVDVKCTYYLNKYQLNKSYIDSNKKYFLK